MELSVLNPNKLTKAVTTQDDIIFIIHIAIVDLVLWQQISYILILLIYILLMTKH